MRSFVAADCVAFGYCARERAALRSVSSSVRGQLRIPAALRLKRWSLRIPERLTAAPTGKAPSAGEFLARQPVASSNQRLYIA